MKTLSEFEAIQIISRVANKAAKPGPTGKGPSAPPGTPSRRLRPSVELGMGDDAAILQVRGELVAVSVDACVEGVHFEYALIGLFDLGFKATQAALSDLAAMGAKPMGFTSSLALPQGFGHARLQALARGQSSAARRMQCPLIGGNITRARELSISTTVLGTVAKARLRSDARPGDEVWLVGSLGLAALGLKLLQARASTVDQPAPLASFSSFERVCVKAWRKPHALISEGERLAARAHALIDVSDGLGQDAGHIADASSVKLILDEGQLRSTWPKAYAGKCRELGLDPLTLCVSGGEDYALIATGSSKKRPAFARPIGVVEVGRGTWLKRERGKLQPISTAGFDHFTAR